MRKFFKTILFPINFTFFNHNWNNNHKVGNIKKFIRNNGLPLAQVFSNCHFLP